jgi:hypothetical protein
MVVILVVFLVGNLVCFLCLVITDSTQVMQATLHHLHRVIWLLSSINIGYLRCEITGWGVCAVDGWTWPSVPPLG